MSQVRDPQDESAAGGMSPDDALPPIEPPSAGFILKLFIVPLVIVLVVLMVVWMFHWLAHMGSEPMKYVDDIERGASNSWQRAHDLSIELRRNEALKRDHKLAERLTAMLARRMKTPPPPEENSEEAKSEVRMRVFLCKVLGEFQIPDPLPTLLAAAKTQRNRNELDVRLAALESLVVLLANLREAHQPIPTQEVLPVVLEASRATGEGGQLLRARAPFALGQIGGAEAQQRLVAMLDDGYIDARYNAATTLAQQGDLKCVDVLEGMLDPNQAAGRLAEKEEGGKEYKEALIFVNGLRASLVLAQKNPDVPLDGLLKAVRRLRSEKKLPTAVDYKAKELEAELAKHAA